MNDIKNSIPIEDALKANGGPTTIDSLKFAVQKSDRLDPIFFFEAHIIHYGLDKTPYFNRTMLDEWMDQVLLEESNAIISAEKNAGKSRMVYEAFIRTTKSFNVIFPLIHPNKFLNKSHSFELDNTHTLKSHIQKNSKEHFYLYWKVSNRFKNFNGCQELFNTLTSFDNLSIIVVGVEKELEHVPQLMDHALLNQRLNFKHFKIPNLTKSQFDEYEGQFSNSLEFNGEPLHYSFTIGSIFSIPSASVEYISELNYKSIEKKVLWSAKLLTYINGSNFLQRSNLVHFTYDLYFKVTSGKKSFSPLNEITVVVDDLSLNHDIFFDISEDDLFIPDHILSCISKGYLTRILSNENLRPDSKHREEIVYIVKEIMKYCQFYPAESWIELSNNLFQNIIYQCKKIQKIELIYTVKEIVFDLLAEKTQFDISTFNTLINQSENIGEAESWNKKRVEYEIRATEKTVVCFARFYTDVDAFSDFQDQLQNTAIDPTKTELLITYISKASTLEDLEKICLRFGAKQLLNIPSFYFTSFINRAQDFPSGIKILNKLEALEIGLEAHFYKAVIQLDGGYFPEGYDLLLKLQEINIELTDFKTIQALSKKKFSSNQDAEILISELKRLPIETVDFNIYSRLTKDYKLSMDSFDISEKVIKDVDIENKKEFHHQLLMLPDLEPENRLSHLDALITSKLAECRSFELYINHPSVTFLNSYRKYYKMVSLGIIPDISIIESIFQKYLSKNIAESQYSNEVLLLYGDIKNLLEFDSTTEFESLFFTLNKVFSNFDKRIELFEIAHGINFKIKPYLGLLYQAAQNHLDASRILDLLFSCKILPTIQDSLRILKSFSQSGFKKENRLELILFLKDLKNLAVNDVILSRLYLSIINDKDSDILPADFFEDLKGVGIKVSEEILVELFYLDLDQRQISEELVRTIFKQYFDEEEISASTIEALVLRSHNFSTAFTIYSSLAKGDSKITLRTTKKLLDYALHSKKFGAVCQVLLEVSHININHLVPLLSKLEVRNNFHSDVQRFVNASDINEESFQNIQHRKYWNHIIQTINEKSKNRLLKSEMIELLDESKDLNDALHSIQSFTNLDFYQNQHVLIDKFIELSIPSDIPKLIKFCIEKNLDFLKSNIVSHFIQFSESEKIRNKLFTKFKDKLKKQNLGHEAYYKQIIPTFYTLLSVAKSFEFSFSELREILELYPKATVFFSGRIALLTQTPDHVKDFVALSKSQDIGISEPMLDHLVLTNGYAKNWDLLLAFKKQIVEFKSLVYSRLLTLNNKAKRNWGNFKPIFQLDKNIKKYPIIATFLISSGIKIPDEIYSYFKSENVHWNLFLNLFTIFETNAVKFPEELIDYKVENWIPKSTNRNVSKSEQQKRYCSLLLAAKSQESIEFLTKRIVSKPMPDQSVLDASIINETSLSQKLLRLEIYSQYTSYSQVNIGEEALINIVETMKDDKDYDKIRTMFSALKNKIDITEKVNANLITKILSIRFQ